MNDTSGSKIGSPEKIWKDLLRRLTKKSTQHSLNETVVSGPPLKPSTSTSLHATVTSSDGPVREGGELDDIGGGSGIGGFGKGGGGQRGNNSHSKESKNFHPIVYILGICIVAFFFYTQYKVQKEKEEQSTKVTLTEVSHVKGVVSPAVVPIREVTPKFIQMQPVVTHTQPVVLQQHIQATVLPQNKYEVSKPLQVVIPVTESQSDNTHSSSQVFQLEDIANTQAEFDKHNDVGERNREAVRKDDIRVKEEFDRFYGVKK